MKPLINCTITETKSKICREEEGKKICFEHIKYEIVGDVVSIDKCVFNKVHGERKCDYLFLFDKKRQQYNFLKNKISPAYYVELKGIDLVSACEQLLNSIIKTKDQISEFEINALVVSSKEFHPKYHNNEYYRDLKRLIKKNIQFLITPHTVNL
ncbi:MAG: hypothetical protein WDM71_08955 [Ferruginibacter sp.]